jgi:hypothetical protein
MGTGDGEEQDLRNERIGDRFILGILLWLRVETAPSTEGEQDLRNERIGDPFILRILLWLRGGNSNEYGGRAGFTE